MSIWLILLACVFGCYFAATHIALKSFSRKRLGELLETRGKDKRLEWLIGHLSGLLLLTGTLRACFNLLVLMGVLLYVESWLIGRAAEWQRLLISFFAAGGLVSVFGVAIPVSWARYRREPLLARSVPLLRMLMILLLPVTVVLNLIDPLIRRLAGTDLVQSEDHPLSDQVLSVVEEHEHESGAPVDPAQKEMLEAVFELPTTTAGEIMTPRTEVHGIDGHAPLAQVKEKVIEFGHSRIPVYEEDLDHIIGVLYAKDLIRLVGNGEQENGGFDLRSVLREAFMVPESKSVRELLTEFKGRKVHLAVVLDEYGGTAGVVTIEDILEELVGDIQDEYEWMEQTPHVERVDATTAEVDARLRIDTLNDEMDLTLPEEADYDTVGGFVFATLGHIPGQGEEFDFDGSRFTVLEAERTKVLRVRVERTGQPTRPTLEPSYEGQT